jgi:hypothetical protein
MGGREKGRLGRRRDGNGRSKRTQKGRQCSK